MKRILLAVLLVMMIFSSSVFAYDGSDYIESFGYVAPEGVNPDDFIIGNDFVAYIDEKLPLSYDLRDEGLVTGVRNQNPYGTCWAFATMAGIESNLLKTTGTEYDLSELQLAYYSYGRQGISDHLGLIDKDYDVYHYSIMNEGGNPMLATFTLASGVGAIYENRLPYETASNFVKSPDPELCYTSDFFLEDSNWASMSQRDVIKKLIMENGAVVTDYLHDDMYLNSKNYAYYYNGVNDTNHAITLVGWDDNFSAENFNIAPEGDGAWLCKNSWGDWFCDDGYFYISYYDTSISNKQAYSFKALVGNDYDIYQYDGTGLSSILSVGGGNYIYSANVYTAQSDLEIDKIGFVTPEPNSEVYIRIYSNPDVYPDSGTEIYYSEEYELFAGFHTFELDEVVTVDKGEKFAVEIGYPTRNGTGKVSISRSGYYCVDYVEEGQSFVYNDEYYRVDLADMRDTARIKVYTTKQQEKYSIIYNLDGGVLQGAKDFYYQNDNDYMLPEPAKNGYKFDGWYEDSDFSGTPVTIIPSGSIGDKYYYAKWSRIPYTIAYETNGGNLEDLKEVYYIDDEDYVLPSPVKKGYSFKGWHRNSDLSDTVISTIPGGSYGNLVLYAEYSPLVYTISYVLDGGLIEEDYRTQFTIEDEIYQLPTPVKKGYLFDGWYVSDTFEEAINVIENGTSNDVTVYAKWLKDKTYIPGDLNDDGKINGQDRILLRNYLTKKIKDSDINLFAADVNSDGVINAQDRVYLRNKVTGKI